jgi:chemotaxis protein MotA
MLIGIFTAGNSTGFASIGGVFIVVGGTLGATFVQFCSADMKYAWRSFLGILTVRRFVPIDRMRYLVTLGHTIKRNGLIVLDREAEKTPDQFLKLALQLAVDGQSEHEIRRMLNIEMRAASERSWHAVSVFETMGNFAPAMGLIGTLIGLIQMLGSLDDPTTVGPAMAVALTTTLYGAVLANLIFLPVAGKLRNYIDQQNALKSITIEGVVSLAREENPVIIEQRLKGFLPLAHAA